MGQTCCGGEKDKNNQNFAGKTIKKGGRVPLDAQQAAMCLTLGNANLRKVYKLQAFARGYICRQKYGSIGRKKDLKRRESDL